MTASSQANHAYGFLTWLNGRDSYVMPGTNGRDAGRGTLIPSAPRDTIIFAGQNEQRTYVIPSLDMVVVRLGHNGSHDLDFRRSVWTGKSGQLDNELMRKLMLAVTNVKMKDPGPYRARTSSRRRSSRTRSPARLRDPVQVLAGAGVGPAAPKGCTPARLLLDSGTMSPPIGENTPNPTGRSRSFRTSTDATATTAAATRPRCSCPRCSSSSARGATRVTTRRSGTRSRPTGATTSDVRRRCTARSGSASASARTVWVKREDLAHTGSHKINNVIGQILLAKRLGKTRIIAETGAGQHGVATATGAALFGLPCVVYMGAEDMERQALNVFRMQMLGAEVVGVDSGSRTLKDAINEAFRDWVTNVETHALRDRLRRRPASVPVAREGAAEGDRRGGAIAQILEHAGALPDVVCACVGGGSNAIGIFSGFVGIDGVRLVGVEPAGHGIETGEHGASVSAGTDGVLHGARTRILQEPDGLITPAHSVSAGLDYPGSGPEHAYLVVRGLGRPTSRSPTTIALEGFRDVLGARGHRPRAGSGTRDRRGCCTPSDVRRQDGAADALRTRRQGRGDGAQAAARLLTIEPLQRPDARGRPPADRRLRVDCSATTSGGTSRRSARRSRSSSSIWTSRSSGDGSTST